MDIHPPAVKMDEDQDQAAQFPVKRLNNTLPIFGNKDTMNINSMILTNIHQSRYFKTELIELKTFHEVIDEIYYKVTHLEPWERNSRKLAGQVGMCAGVRGVAAGGIVSTPFCLLFKLFTLRLTRKQVTVMLNHADSPYIRGLGFMYIRYCQPPKDLLSWFDGYFEDEEEIDLKAGGGFKTTIGGMCRMMLSKMEWFGTMFPRVPVTVQKEIKDKLEQLNASERERESALEMESPLSDEQRERPSPDNHDNKFLERSPRSMSKDGSRSPGTYRRRRSSSRDRHDSRSRNRHRSRSRDRHRSRDSHSSRSKNRHRSRSRDRHRSRSRDRHRSRSRDRSRSRERRDKRRSRSRDRYRSSRRSKSTDRRRSRSPNNRHQRRSKDRARSPGSRRRSRDRSLSPGSGQQRSRSRSPQNRYKDSKQHRSRSKETKRHSKRSRSRSESPHRYHSSRN